MIIRLRHREFKLVAVVMRLRHFFLLLTLLAIPGSAQSPAKILKQAEKAMGGSKAMQSTTSWMRNGSIRRVSDGASGRFVMQSMRPNLYNLSFDIGGFEIESGYNGKSGWTRDSRNGCKHRRPAVT